MPRFTGNLQGIKLKGDFTKRMERDLERMNRQAAREWLRAVFVHVAVWTGMARGSLKFAKGAGGDLAAFLNVAIPISPKEYRPGKNAEAGGRKAKYSFSVNKHRYGFYFRSDVVHFDLNEFFQSVSPTSPWHSFRYGAEAYQTYIRMDMARLPKITEFRVKYKVQIG